MSFTTNDMDNDPSPANCARYNRGGWWYRKCYKANLNGEYEHGDVPDFIGIVWDTFRGTRYSLKSASMKLLPAF